MRSRVTAVPGSRKSTPPSTASALPQFSISPSLQRIFSRSSRSPTLTPARQAGDEASSSNGPFDVVDQPVIVGVEAERAERLGDPEQVRDDHREAPQREPDQE